MRRRRRSSPPLSLIRLQFKIFGLRTCMPHRLEVDASFGSPSRVGYRAQYLRSSWARCPPLDVPGTAWGWRFLWACYGPALGKLWAGYGEVAFPEKSFIPKFCHFVTLKMTIFCRHFCHLFGVSRKVTIFFCHLEGDKMTKIWGKLFFLKLASTWGRSFIWPPRAKIICDIHWPGRGGKTAVQAAQDGDVATTGAFLPTKCNNRIKQKGL